MNLSEIRSRLDRHKVVNLSYQYHSEPYACAVWFALYEDNELIYISDQNTFHSNCLLTDGRVAFTVNKDDQSWESIIGFQGKGIVHLIDDKKQINSVKKVYLNKFQYIKSSKELLERLNNIDFWSVKISWLRIIDNSVRFGWKKEFIGNFEEI